MSEDRRRETGLLVCLFPPSHLPAGAGLSVPGMLPWVQFAPGFRAAPFRPQGWGDNGSLLVCPLDAPPSPVGVIALPTSLYEAPS